MTTARKILVDQSAPCYYHIVSRCVRQAWLCGKHGGRDYSHRKRWLIKRFKMLAKYFPIEIHAYAVLSNHFHLVLYYNPLAPAAWTNEEVVERWLQICPPKDYKGRVDPGLKELRKELYLSNLEQVQKIRVKLGSLSTFMKLLKQPVARRANLEDECEGHFFEKRFFSAALLTDEALLAAMAYVDLNPIRAKLTRKLKDSEHTSIAERLSTHELEHKLRPISSGLAPRQYPSDLTLERYLWRLKLLTAEHSDKLKPKEDSISRWRHNVSLLKRKQRAFGYLPDLTQWLERRGLRFREQPMY